MRRLSKTYIPMHDRRFQHRLLDAGLPDPLFGQNKSELVCTRSGGTINNVLNIFLWIEP
jgi:hypothetical protein